MNCVVGRREGGAGDFGRSLRIHIKRSHGHDVIEKEEQFSAFLVSMTKNTVASRSGVAPYLLVVARLCSPCSRSLVLCTMLCVLCRLSTNGRN